MHKDLPILIVIVPCERKIATIVGTSPEYLYSSIQQRGRQIILDSPRLSTEHAFAFQDEEDTPVECEGSAVD